MTVAMSLKEYYVEHHPGDAVALINSMPELIDEVASLPVTGLIELMEHADLAPLSGIFDALPAEKRLQVLEGASIRTNLLILNNMAEAEREAFLQQLPETPRKQLRELMTFSEETAGFYMDKPVAWFRGTDTVAQALEKLRTSDHHRVRSVYIVNADGTLLGRVDMQDMALAEKATTMSDLVHPVEGFANLTSPRAELTDIFEEHRVDSIPIIDQEGRLIGVVRYASLFHAAGDTLTADMQKMVGVSVEERALSPPLFAVKKRLPWLHINLLTAFLAASVVGVFESIIAQFTALAILLPVVAGQSGNAGAQALAVTMRGLALKEISILRWRTVLMKEVTIGVVDGLVLAVTCGLGVLVWSQSFGLALVIAIAMICSMIAAGIAGALVPMFLIRIGQDPATASSIILTTVTDVAGFISFLGTATLLSFMLV